MKDPKKINFLKICSNFFLQYRLRKEKIKDIEKVLKVSFQNVPSNVNAVRFIVFNSRLKFTCGTPPPNKIR
jgi:hypothetical protein